MTQSLPRVGDSFFVIGTSFAIPATAGRQNFVIRHFPAGVHFSASIT